MMAGGGAMAVAIVHVMIGQKIITPLDVPRESSKRILHALMFLSGVYWFVAGGVLALTPTFLSGEVRQWTVYACAAMLLSGALGNMWGTRGKHFGGYLLLVISGFALAGAG